MTLDPQAKALLQMMAESDAPLYHTLPPVKARQLYENAVQGLKGEPEQPFAISELEIPGPESQLPALVYRPSEAKNLPVLVFFHGGGYTIGSVKSHDVVCRGLCVLAQCLVVSVDYRLAPEHPFPAAVDDAWASVNWVVANAASLGADPRRVAVGGDSAGGNLAAVVCLMAKQTGAPELAFQLLIYPGTEMSCSFPSHQKFAEGYRLTAQLIDWFLDNYFSPGTDRSQWRASPLNAEDFRDLPPAFVLSAGFDPLQDENKAYADKLKKAGVAVEYSHYEGMIHGFITMPGVLDKAGEAIRECAEKLHKALYPGKS